MKRKEKTKEIHLAIINAEYLGEAKDFKIYTNEEGVFVPEVISYIFEITLANGKEVVYSSNKSINIPFLHQLGKFGEDYEITHISDKPLIDEYFKSNGTMKYQYAGVRIHFTNNWSISVQFSTGNYCDNSRKQIAVASETCEIAIFNPEDDMVPFEETGDTVMGYCDAQTMIYWAYETLCKD